MTKGRAVANPQQRFPVEMTPAAAAREVADTTLLVQQLLSLGSTALPFVISTGAQRSGEICGLLGRET
jgi:hypothetical protein